MRRPGYANVVATLALVVALGGTSYAAVKITGKDVKNNSLSGKDVKNESLTGKDVKKRSVPLDRLSGSLPTQLDPGQFVPSSGSLHRLRRARCLGGGRYRARANRHRRPVDVDDARPPARPRSCSTPRSRRRSPGGRCGCAP